MFGWEEEGRLLLTVAVAQGDTHSRSDDTHGCGYRDTVYQTKILVSVKEKNYMLTLRGKSDGDGTAQFHRETTRGRHEGKSISEHLHDIVSV